MRVVTGRHDEIETYILSEHAALEIKRRQIPRDVVDLVLQNPEQTCVVRTGRVVAQSRVRMGNDQKTYLVRVFVDVDRKPAEVVTAYRTSKIEKYWKR